MHCFREAAEWLVGCIENPWATYYFIAETGLPREYVLEAIDRAVLQADPERAALLCQLRNLLVGETRE